LGECSTEHERLIYELSQHSIVDKLSTTSAVMLAALGGHLVDSNKQGWHLNVKDWYQLRRESSWDRPLDQPAYRTGRRPDQRKLRNLLDHLRFDVAHRERDKILTEFSSLTDSFSRHDPSLSQFWHRARQSLGDSDPSTSAVLDGLLSDIRQLRDRAKLGTKVHEAREEGMNIMPW
jgi:hypothetical protein